VFLGVFVDRIQHQTIVIGLSYVLGKVFLWKNIWND